jgi:hypothetical protein
MRLTLAIVMTVAQLAGPWLCCCGSARVAVAVGGPVSNAPPVGEPSHGGCPHCPKDAPTCPPADDTPNAPHVPDRCPCGGVLATAVPADKPSVPTPDRLLVGVSVEPPQPVASAVAAPPAVVGCRELPHLTTADRLFAHHVLRC